MTKKALLVVSFGTSYPETRAKTIGAIEADLRARYPDRDFFRAFTAKMIIKKLAKRDGEIIDTPHQAMEKLAAAGYTDVLCQSTHVINGTEYDWMIADLRGFTGRFEHLRVGRPLLTRSDDFVRVADIMASEARRSPEADAWVYMGHGTSHHTNSVYPAMDYYLKHTGDPRLFMGTVEGYPALDDILPELTALGCRRVGLMPFMIVAGDHACNDMAGDDEESWKNRLEAAGFEVTCRVTGMGELPAIRELFIEHADMGVEIKEMS